MATEAPTVSDMQNYLSNSDKHESKHQFGNQRGNEFETIDMSELYFSFSQPVTVVQSIPANLAKHRVDTNTIVNVFDKLQKFELNDNASLLTVVNSYQQQPQSPVSYQIVGDNVDLEVKVRHMTKDNKNKSFH